MKRQQQGYILLATLALMLAGGAAWLLGNLNPRLEDLAQQQKADLRSKQLEALEEARMRLLAKSMELPANPGVMPCPDPDNDGLGGDGKLNGFGNNACTPNEAQTAGRFPYKDLPTLDSTAAKTAVKDASGACVWYATSPVLRSMAVTQRLENTGDRAPINPDTPSVIQVNSRPVFALLIAPGDALLNQDKARKDASPCAEGKSSDFLDALGDTNNAKSMNEGKISYFADSATATALNASTGKCMARDMISAPTNIGAECSNDVILPITRADLMKPLLREVLERLATETAVDTTTALPSGCSPANTQKTIDAAMPANGRGTLAALRNTNPACFDYHVFADMDLSMEVKTGSSCFDTTGERTSKTPLWLCANDWYRFINYDSTGSYPILSIKLDAADPASYRCSIELNPALSPEEKKNRTATCQ